MFSFAVFLPLLSYFFCIIANGKIKDHNIEYFASCLILLSTIISILCFFAVSDENPQINIQLAEWLSSGSLYIDWSLSFNRLSSLMVLLVNFISCLVHFYSIGYMSNDQKKIIFIGYLGLFTFFMLILVTSSNLIQLFLGWEGVGLTSYLLIGFWNFKDVANKAAIKAFIVNRVGDFSFLIGILVIFILFGTLNFNEIFILVQSQKNTYFELFDINFHALTLISVLLFIGCMGKSAQLGLHTWLPDAMEGPTPVSALIHAATMVTAGVFLLVLMSPIIEESQFAQNMIMIVGALTSFFAATVAITQDDIKRIIAYSTCSQLGYMFVAIGASAYGVAMFHLVTHAFFKALLFLGAGSVIHAMSDEQNIKKMGGLYKKIPVTYLLMLIGTLSITGFPFFSGYFSKDLIIEILYFDKSIFREFAFFTSVFVVFLTSFYSFRLLIYVFHGKNNSDEKVLAHVHESPNVMLIPLLILSIFAIFSGILLNKYFFGINSILFWKDSLYNISTTNLPTLIFEMPFIIKKIPFFMALLGLFICILFYRFFPNITNFLKKRFSLVYIFLKNKWYFDEFYDLIFVKPLRYIGNGFWKSIDIELIDNVGPNGISKLIKKFGMLISIFHTGYLYHYAMSIIIGLTVFISIYFYIF